MKDTPALEYDRSKCRISNDKLLVPSMADLVISLNRYIQSTARFLPSVCRVENKKLMRINESILKTIAAKSVTGRGFLNGSNSIVAPKREEEGVIHVSKDAVIERTF